MSAPSLVVCVRMGTQLRCFDNLSFPIDLRYNTLTCQEWITILARPWRTAHQLRARYYRITWMEWRAISWYRFFPPRYPIPLDWINFRQTHAQKAYESNDYFMCRGTSISCNSNVRKRGEIAFSNPLTEPRQQFLTGLQRGQISARVADSMETISQAVPQTSCFLLISIFDLAEILVRMTTMQQSYRRRSTHVSANAVGCSCILISITENLYLAIFKEKMVTCAEQASDQYNITTDDNLQF